LASNEDKLIVDALLKGDDTAWDQMSKLVEAWLINAAQRRYIPDADIQDLRQEILAKLLENNYKKLQQFSFMCRLSTWIGSVVQNHLFDHFSAVIRREKRNHAFETIRKEIVDHRELTEKIIDEVDLSRLMDKALESLSPSEQVSIRMIYWDGLTVSEASVITGEKISSITSRLTRAREKLRAIMTTGTDKKTI
jgi:RNA polymerase sigma-70 factor (ECF subfamily)